MTNEELCARLEKVERENRRIRAGGLTALLVFVAITAIGQAAPEEKVEKALRVEKFEVMDGDGKLRASLGVDPDGSPHLRLYDKDEKIRCSIDVLADGGASLRLMDGEQTIRGSFDVQSNGAPTLRLMDSLGKIRSAMDVSPEGIPSATFFDKDGKVLEGSPK